MLQSNPPECSHCQLAVLGMIEQLVHLSDSSAELTCFQQFIKNAKPFIISGIRYLLSDPEAELTLTRFRTRNRHNNNLQHNSICDKSMTEFYFRQWGGHCDMETPKTR